MLGRTSILLSLKRTMTTTSESSLGPVETAIRTKLTALLNPTDFVIQNDSHKHKHHAPMRAYDGDKSETHFSLQIVSSTFAGLHALSLKTKTPEEIAAATESTA
ncbi:bola-like protein [Auriculariales sp. MPI-PUGE-AT-0066]|nr:bola-like protein [Auriculariales sp. MPI-PUGE-AT-0066]